MAASQVLRREAGVTYRTGGKPGRNDPCDCGSGRKRKACCGAKPRDLLDERLARANAEVKAAERAILERDSLRAQESQPTRARAVLAYIEQHLPAERESGPTRAEEIASSVRKARHARGRARKRQGRPDRLNRDEKRNAFHDPEGWLSPEDAELELGTQEMNRLMRKLRKEGLYQGAVSLGLAAAALYVSPQVMAEADLHGHEHEAALTEWFVGNWGQFIHNTALDPGAYLAWRHSA